MKYFLWAGIILFTLFIREGYHYLMWLQITALLVYYAGIRKGELKGMFLGSLSALLKTVFQVHFLVLIF